MNNIKDFIWNNQQIKESIIKDSCYVEGTCGDKRFKDIETPSIEDLYNNMIELNDIDIKGKSCAIIGNSSILLDTEYGEIIDNHDIVIRCNVARTTGFEKNVGSKTTFRFIAAKSFTRDVLPSHSEYDFNFLPSLNNEHFFIRYDHPNTKALIGGMLNNYRGNNYIHYLSPYFILECDKLNNSYSSIGFISIIFGTRFFDKVSLYGFNFFKEGIEKGHYFEGIQKGTNVGHNFDSEENVILQLQENNRLRVYNCKQRGIFV